MSVEKNDVEGAELERQNGVLNRFAEALREFQAREGLSDPEVWNVLMATAAHNMAHGGVVEHDSQMEFALSLFVGRARENWQDHKRDCLGGADGRQHDH